MGISRRSLKFMDNYRLMICLYKKLKIFHLERKGGVL